ncbi:MAG: TdeIII family type II restriction endonuclease [Deltaproteobacteria bacterium]|nr:TdeIII family type II restriction endonuclease [Deltaproteobacteria bacterium]
MENTNIKDIIKASMFKLLNDATVDAKIKKIIHKHGMKTHFMPLEYRVLGGLLQSLNIQFGNFIEVLLQRIIKEEDQFRLVDDISGKKNVSLSMTEKTDSLIDSFISERQNSSDDNVSKKFEQLLHDIVIVQQLDGKLITGKHDVDLLFQDRSGVYYYVELKYNDDHDTGKFVDINRKFLKTYAGLVKKLAIRNASQLKPIIYYFTRKRMKGNIYVPEERNIYRGEKFFNEFLRVQYEDLDSYLKNVSSDQEIIKIFDDLYQKVRFGR